MKTEAPLDAEPPSRLKPHRTVRFTIVHRQIDHALTTNSTLLVARQKPTVAQPHHITFERSFITFQSSRRP
ncbi:hypothetical protein BRARA_G00472 [Brassica rapa]|uniref:Uncharacterized protein n=1 Tax=Brassica campestris TaxID=3711 RepID=A0A397YHU8_BRACM|nr:hypothetical protein BRARA_G00472 [Brassica rapa]